MMIKEFLTQINLPDVAAGGIVAGTLVWFVRNPKNLFAIIKWAVGRNGNGHRPPDTETLTIGKHSAICAAVVDPLKKDTTDIKMRVVEIGTDVSWVKKRLENGEYDFRELHRKIDALKK